MRRRRERKREKKGKVCGGRYGFSAKYVKTESRATHGNDQTSHITNVADVSGAYERQENIWDVNKKGRERRGAKKGRGKGRER